MWCVLPDSRVWKARSHNRCSQLEAAFKVCSPGLCLQALGMLHKSMVRHKHAAAKAQRILQAKILAGGRPAGVPADGACLNGSPPGLQVVPASPAAYLRCT